MKSNWRSNPPKPEDFDSEEDYESALEDYDNAIDEDIEEYFLSRNE